MIEALLNQPLFSWLVIDVVLKSSLVLAMAMFVTAMMRRGSAAARHLVWACALVACLITPIISRYLPGPQVLPHWTKSTVSANDLSDLENPDARSIAWLTPETEQTLTILADLQAAKPQTQVTTGEAYTRLQQLSEQRVTTYVPAVTDNEQIASVTLLDEPALAVSPWIGLIDRYFTSVVVGGWSFGFALLMLPIILGSLGLYQLARHARLFPRDLNGAMLDYAAELGVERRVVGLISASACLPMTWGFWRPTILLPPTALAWTAERKRMVLMHELSHIRRSDYVTQLIGQFVRAVFWFNPLAWYALRQLQLEQEQACDDRVLGVGVEADQYASELLSLSSGVPRDHLDAALALALGRTQRLERRLKTLLNPQCNRRPLSVGQIVVSTGLCALGFLLIASLDERSANAQTGAEKPAEATPAPQAPANQVEPIAANEPIAAEPAAAVQNNEAQAEQKKPDTREELSAAELASLMQHIETLSALPVDAAKLREGAIRGMLQALSDPHSGVLSPEEMKSLEQQIAGRLVGIGVMLKVEDDEIKVLQALPHSAAWKAGLKPGDVITAVDGDEVKDLTQAVRVIRGMSGTTVRLRLNGKAEDVSLVRGEVTVPAVQGWAIDGNGKWLPWLNRAEKIGYISITEFNASTSSDVEALLAELKRDGCKGLVLDLRECPGGIMHEVVNTASLLISDAELVTIESRQEQSQTLRTEKNAPYADMPLVILAGSHSASAAEIVAGAFQVHGRAIVVGSRTYGKGTVQAMVPISKEGATLKLTTAIMKLPGGRSIQRAPGSNVWGVDPNDGYYVPESGVAKSMAAHLAPVEAAPELTLNRSSSSTTMKSPLQVLKHCWQRQAPGSSPPRANRCRR